jgi:hypothetical protein
VERNEIRHGCKDGEYEAGEYGDHCLGDDSNNYLWFGDKPTQPFGDERGLDGMLDGMKEQTSCDLQGHEAGRKVPGEKCWTLSSVTAPDARPEE